MKRIVSICLFLTALSLSFVACTENTDKQTSTNMETGEKAPAAKAKLVSHTVAGIQVGDQAPNFNLKNIDEKMYSLEDIKDANGEAAKGYIITFTCNTCPVAKMYEDRIIALHNKMSALGYPVVAIQPNDPSLKPGDSFAEMQKRAADKEYPFAYLFDDGQEIFPQYGASRTPEVYLVDNTLKLRYHGAIDDNSGDPDGVTINYVENAVSALQNGQDPNPADIKAVGCGIKAKRT